jgi:hypothetical protein
VLANKEYLPAIRLSNVLNSFRLFRWISENSYLCNYVNASATLFFKDRLVKQNVANELHDNSQASIGTYKEKLAVALIKRLYAITSKHDAHFILLDIPSETLVPSFPRFDSDELKAMADRYVDSSLLLKQYQGLVDLYRPHGQNHWTEMSHLLVGIELGNIILEQWEERERGRVLDTQRAQIRQ